MTKRLHKVVSFCLIVVILLLTSPGSVFFSSLAHAEATPQHNSERRLTLFLSENKCWGGVNTPSIVSDYNHVLNAIVYTYAVNTVVTVEAWHCDPGWVFDRWEGPVTNQYSATTTVTMDQDHTITVVATPQTAQTVPAPVQSTPIPLPAPAPTSPSPASPVYPVSPQQAQHTLIVESEGGGSLGLQPSPNQMDLFRFGGTYDIGTMVIVSAFPTDGWRFSHWIGPVANQYGATTTVTMNRDHTVTAVYVNNDPTAAHAPAQTTPTPTPVPTATPTPSSYQPVVTHPFENQTFQVRMGQPFILDILASHPEERPLTYKLAAYPYPLKLDPHSGRVTWTPDDPDYLRKNMVTFYVAEDHPGVMGGQTVYRTFFIEVLPGQQEPAPTEHLAQPSPAMVQPSTNQPSTDPSPSPSLGVTIEEPATELPSSIEEDTKVLERLLRDVAQEAERMKMSQTLGVGGLVSEPAIPSIPDDFIFERELFRTMGGEDVKYLQMFLNWQGCMLADSGPGSSGQETTYFGDHTWRAVVCFQEKYPAEILGLWNLEEGTGYFGPSSRAKANQLLQNARKARDMFAPRFEGGTISQGDLDPSFWQTADELLTEADHLGNALMPLQGVGAPLKIPKAVLMAVTKAKVSIQAAGTVIKAVRIGISTTKDANILRQAVQRVGYARRLIAHLAKYGEEGVLFVERVAGQFSRTGLRLAENNPKQGLLHMWNGHVAEWRRLGINSPEQLKQTIQEVVAKGRAGIHSYLHQGSYEGQIWFYDQARKIYVAARKNEGVWEIWTAFPRSWQSIEKLKWMFEIK